MGRRRKRSRLTETGRIWRKAKEGDKKEVGGRKGGGPKEKEMRDERRYMREEEIRRIKWEKSRMRG